MYSTRYEKLFLDIAYSYFLCVANIVMYIVLLTHERRMRALSYFYRLFDQHCEDK